VFFFFAFFLAHLSPNLYNDKKIYIYGVDMNDKQCRICNKELQDNEPICSHCGYNDTGSDLRLSPSEMNNQFNLNFMPPEEKQRLTGIGGWLVLPQIGFLASICSLVPTLISSEYFLFQKIINGILFITVCIAVMAFYNKKSSIKRIMMIMYLSSVFALVLQLVIMHLAFKYIIHEQLAMEYTTTEISNIIRSSLSAAIWIAYFYKSKRVRLTFTN
jgi:hypothetical protein